LSGYTATLTGGTAQANVWQHICGVYDGANATLYVNGQLVAGPTSAAGFAPNQLQPLRLGATTLPNRTYDGWLDEVAVYSRALPAGTIAAHYSAASTNNSHYGTQILSDAPIAYWHLDDPVYVAPAAGALPVAFNSGTATNVYGLYEPGSVPGVSGVPAGGLGATNTACQFNGAVGYIDIPGPFPDLTNAATVVAWIKSNPTNGTFQTVLSAGDTSYHLDVDGTGHPHFDDGGQTFGDLVGGASVADGQWHQLAGVYDGATSEYLYVDGQLADSSGSATLPVLGSGGDVWIGDAPGHAAYQAFNGVIDEVSIFGAALSQAQIQQLFSAATQAQVLVNVVYASHTLTFTWNAFPGLSYQLQYKTSLSDPNWLDLGAPVTTSGSTATASDSPPTGPSRFYRVLLLL
jgi:hypothetical protein